MVFGQRYVDIWFKDTAEGRAFYPYGPSGSGYLLDAAQEAVVRSRLRAWLAAVSTLIVAQFVLQLSIDALAALGLVAVPMIALTLLYAAWVHKAKARWTRASAPITRAEVLRAYAAGVSKARLAVMLAASVLLAAASAALLLAPLEQPGIVRLAGLSGAAFFGWCAVSVVKIARLRG